MRQENVRSVVCVVTGYNNFISKDADNRRRCLGNETRGKTETEGDSNSKFHEEIFDQSEAWSELSEWCFSA